LQFLVLLNLLVKLSILSNTVVMQKPASDTFKSPIQPSARRRAVIETARELGLLVGENGRIGGRVRRELVAAAKMRSGIASDTELLEYALAKVALEDDFGTKLVRRKGRIAQDLDLEL
jgi:hypothetical protein